MIKTRFYQLVITTVTALIGGLLFKLMHLPVAWLLGPMIVVLIGSSLLKGCYRWPGQIRNTGMIIVGYTIGLSMTPTALHEMAYQFPTMVLMTVLLFLLCASMAYVVSKLGRSDYLSVLMGSIPGGLTQVIILAEETEGVNITVVTVMQVIRLMMIIICIPMLIFSSVFGRYHLNLLTTQAPSVSHIQETSLSSFLLFASVSVICALAGNKIRFPTAYLLGPAIGTAVLQVIGLHGPQLPSLIINAAQFMIGTYVGLLLKPDDLTQNFRTIVLAMVNGMMLVLGALGLSLLLIKFHPVSMPTALLSLAPGGIDQMGIIAHEVHADLSMVAGYQLFRTFFIFFAVPSILRLIINQARKKQVKCKCQIKQ